MFLASSVMLAEMFLNLVQKQVLLHQTTALTSIIMNSSKTFKLARLLHKEKFIDRKMTQLNSKKMEKNLCFQRKKVL